MTTRLLASFNVLDHYSKDVLDKHARTNRLLSQLPVVCFASCHEPDLSLPIDCGPSARRRTSISKPKNNNKIISVKQELLNDKLRCFMLRASKSSKVSREDSTCGPGHTARYSKVTIRPFTSPEDLASRTGPVKGQEMNSEGFTVVTFKNNSSSFKATKHLPQKQKRSREVDRIQLQGLGREYSRALVGGTLCYTDRSNWCSSLLPQDTSLTAFTETKEEQFTLSESVGKVVCQQLEHGNVVRVCTSRSRRNEESSVIDSEREEQSDGDEATVELEPLSFLDVLERKSAKILTPRAPSAYTPLPIVSETYPVLCSSDEYKHKPFSSSGFHTLDLSQRPPSSRMTVPSAIVHITESLHAEAMEKRRREKEKEARLDIGALWNQVSDIVSLRVLSADGNIAKDTDLGRTTLCRKKLSTVLTTPSLTGRAPHEFLRAPSIPLTSPLTASPIQRHGSSKAVGPVLNGMNPKLAETVCPQESYKHLHTETRKSLTRSTLNNIHRETTNSQINKRIFAFISKPLQNNLTDISHFVSSDQQPNREWSVLKQETFHNYVVPEDVQIMSAGTDGVNCFFQRSNDTNEGNKCPTSGAMCPLLHSPDYIKPPATPYFPERETQLHAVVNGGAEDCSVQVTTNNPFDPERAINIPTAE